MKKYLLFIFLLLISELYADSEMGCSISDLLQAPKSSLLENIEESNCTESEEPKMTKTGITENLVSIDVLHETKLIVIEREMNNNEMTCPPFCIEPMNIKDVVTVAELEVLTFIDKLKEKKARLLIDVRENSAYNKATIPGAINLPFSMLKDKSKYQEEVLKLLGAKLNKKSSNSKNHKLKWSFKNAQSLLIFGGSAMSSEASSSIMKLLELGYPSSKIFYYRSGIKSWKMLGLTTH
jgi:rhodanese-related sulfurtransferase